MGPNDADIIRVYTREANGQVADVTLGSSTDAEVIVEAEAGSAVYSMKPQYYTGLFVVDLVSGQQIPFTPPPATGQVGNPPWTSQATEFAYTIAATDLAQHKGHLCKVYAYVLIGGSDFDASFAESPVFLILP